MQHSWTRDRFATPDPPDGAFYQWNVLSTGIATGWNVVPYDRHRKWFGAEYLGNGGLIICDGLVLMEKSSEEIKMTRKEAVDKAYENYRKAHEKIQQAAAESNCEVSIKVTHERG
jgi:hypothetical protein